MHVLIGLVHELKRRRRAWPRPWPWPATAAPSPTLADMTAWSSLDGDRGPVQRGRPGHRGRGGRPPRRGGAALRRPTAPASSTGSGPSARRQTAFKHIAPLVGHFDATSEAVALEVAADHALIQVVPLSGEGRHAHLCEMTRGLLSQVPALYGLGPALITETECSARGGRFCLYAAELGGPVDRPGPTRTTPSRPADQGTPRPAERRRDPTGWRDRTGPPRPTAGEAHRPDGRSCGPSSTG